MKTKNRSLGMIASVPLTVVLFVILAIGILPWLVPAALADTPGTWTSTGSMGTARANPTATLLPNGKVLITGGQAPPPSISLSLATAELYDPASGTFSPTGSMGSARVLHTATLLPTGMVLVTGGNAFPGGPPIAMAELYDPATGIFTPTGSMVTPRLEHLAVLLPNGKVLVIGGCCALAQAELYDPATGTFTSTGSMGTGRFNHTATLLPTGEVLVAGGNPGFGATASAELYDPVAGTFSPTGSLGTARNAHTAILLPNGKVLVSGGEIASGAFTSSAELYDPATGTFAMTGSMGTARVRPLTVVLPNGKVLLAGGQGATSQLASAELYDPVTGIFTGTGSMGSAHTSFGNIPILLPNGKVLVAGGTDGTNFLASAELYCPEMLGTAGTWTATGSMTVARNQARLIVLTLGPNAGKALIAGRNGNSFTDASAELYNPATGTWATTGTPNTTRQGYVATVLPNGKVLIAGGVPAPGGVLSTAELYDPIAGTWSSTGSMASGRVGFGAVLLTSGPNAGKVLVEGGFTGSTSVASAELFNPASGTWASTGSMATARHSFTANLLPNGKVLVVGGLNQASLTALATAELYDPATGTWSSTGSMTTARFAHAAILLTLGPNAGQVLVAGGVPFGGSPFASAELYDPTTGTWTSTGSMTTARFDTESFATLLPNGKVLAVGGFGSSGDLSSAEQYDPANGTWTTTGSMSAARAQHGITLLPTGQVLVAGGSGAGLASAELFSTAICEAEVAPTLLLIDEDSIDNGTKSIEAISFNPPFCGGPAGGPGNPAVCVNDDIANPAVRTLLFTRGHDVTPLTGLTLSTGQVGDEGLFKFTNPDPQMSEQNGATFTMQEFFTATGAAADENNLDKVAGVMPLGQTDIEALQGQTVCAVVYDSDISVDRGKGHASLKGATMGVTAFKVTAATANPAGGSYLPDLTVDVLPSAQVAQVCENLQPNGGNGAQ